MTRSPTSRTPHPIAMATREACLRAMLEAYEDARIRGLCHEGAWECALGAIQDLELGNVMHIVIKRVYEAPEEEDGTRVLVDRLWPRGLSREHARVDVWAKELSPSPELRQWFDHDPDKFDDFAKKYRKELQMKQAEVESFLSGIDKHKRLTLLYAAKNPLINHALVLKAYLQQP